MKSPSITRRSLLKAASSVFALATIPKMVLAQQQPERKNFDPLPSEWRTFEVTTNISPQKAGASTVWVPLPSVNTEWQRSMPSKWTGNATSARIETDKHYGAQYLVAEFDGSAPPVLEITSAVQTRNRSHEMKKPANAKVSQTELRRWLQPTDLMPLDGIVRVTAKQVVEGARTDEEKVQRIYDWIIVSTFREPKVRGCGTGDVKAMLETGNMGGKCADLNGLFVALSRAAGVPARDAYGIRLAKSEFGYKELGGKPESLKGAQHCRAEVYLRKHGWVAMDPADVCKVMRQETADWIKDPDHALVVPVRKSLFGGWEGNWMAYNFAHDVKLPGFASNKVGFLMYPQAQTNGEAYDPLDADSFKYTITSREI